jgi:aryl-alcohol dehydrogenase-like predicted oxidoreductase
MEKRMLGRTGLEVSVLGFGGAEIGFEGASAGDVRRLLNGALDAGLNVIDTAECYLQSEELIGEAVSGRRQDFHLFTKCGHPEQMGRGDWRPASLLQSIERSLRRLRTDHLEVVHLHSCSEEELCKGDVIRALQEARQRGYTRFIGYSGDGEAAHFAVECGEFDTLQTSVSIADQEALDLTLPLARERNLGVIAKRPLANAVWRYKTRPDNWYVQTYWDRLQALDYPFLHDAAHAAEMALRFTLSVPGVHTMIVGTKSPTRWQENSALVEKGMLSREQFEAIRARWKQVATANWVGQV